MTIYQKIFEIMCEVEELPKTAYNDIEKYHYVPEAVVTEYIRKKLIEKNMLLLYSATNTETTTNNKAKVIIEYEFIDVQTTEKVSGKWVGEGWSSSGYATSMAITSACKQHQMKTFFIPSGDDPETTNGSSPEPKTGTVNVVIPPIVAPEKVAEPHEVIPGNVRKKRSPNKALAAVEAKIEEPVTEPTAIKPPTIVISPVHEMPEPAQIPTPEPEQAPIPVAEVSPATETSPAQETLFSEEPSVEGFSLVSMEQMQNGITTGTVKEITKVEVVSSKTPVFYAYGEPDETGKKKVVYATIK